MQQHKRANKKWTINEALKLQREYELLGMDVNQIAIAHERSANAIAHRLEHEKIIDKWSDARGYKEVDIVLSCHDTVSEISEQLDDDVRTLNERMEALIARVSVMEQTVAETNASMALMFMSKQNLKCY
jgi:hypothetical protein